MKLSDIKIDSARAESKEGDWVENIPDLPGIRIKARGSNNADYRLLEQKLVREIPRHQRLEAVSPADQDRIAATLLLETVLIDVEGLTEEDGKTPLAYTKDLGKTLLFHPDFRVFHAGVAYAAAVVAQRRKAEDEDDAKN